MTWEQKLHAMNALGEVSLKMRCQGDWYLSHGVEIGGDGMLRSVNTGGASPESVVERTWQEYVSVSLPRRLVIGAYSGKRREVLWNGFMWEDVAP